MSALDDFRNSLATVHALVKLEAKLNDPPTLQERATSDGLRGSVVVLTLACFEGFLQTLFEEQLDRIVQSKVPLSYFDQSLQVSAVYSSLEFAHKGEVGQQLERPDRMPASIMIARTVGAGGFTPRALASTRSNPSSENVAKMFNAVGRTKVWTTLQASFEAKWPTQVSQSFCKDKLDELVRSRNRVAHTAVASHVVRSYLLETASIIVGLGESISETLQAHINSCIASASAKQAETADLRDDWATSSED